MRRWPSLNQLNSLRHVARLGGFSRAAAELGLTQPAVSLQIRQLEESYGVPLLERIGKRAHATPAGALLLEHAERAFAELELAAQRLREQTRQLTGALRLGASATAMIYLLPPALGAFRARHPNVQMRVVTGNTPEMVSAVIANDLDLAIVTGKPANRALACETFYRDRLVAIAPAGGYDAVGPGPLGPSKIALHPLVLYEQGGLIRRAIDRWFKAGGAHPASLLEIGSAEALKRMVVAGLGLSITSAISIAGEVESGILREIPLEPDLERTLTLIWRKDRSANPVLAAAREGLAELRAELDREALDRTGE